MQLKWNYHSNIAVTCSLLTLLSLTGCASSESNNLAANESDENLVCEYVRVTGSNLKKKICMTPRQRELERERALKDMNDVQRRIAHESSVTGL